MGIPGETSRIFQPTKETFIGPETKQAAEERTRAEAAEEKKQLEASKKGNKRYTFGFCHATMEVFFRCFRELKILLFFITENRNHRKSIKAQSLSQSRAMITNRRKTIQAQSL